MLTTLLLTICYHLVMVSGSVKHNQFRTYLLDIEEKDTRNRELQAQLTVATDLIGKLAANNTVLVQRINDLEQKVDVQHDDIQNINDTINIRK